MQTVREKESELDDIVRHRTETIEKLEAEIGRLKQQKIDLRSVMQTHSLGIYFEKRIDNRTGNCQ